MEGMPPAHPHFEGFGWELDPEGQIVSSFYGNRYEVHIHDLDAIRRDEWRPEVEAERRREAEARDQDGGSA
jgi:hypothetical protein